MSSCDDGLIQVLVGGIDTVLRLNHSLVSLLIATLNRSLTALWNLYRALERAVFDLLDQYGACCEGAVALCESILVHIGQILYTVSSAFSAVLLFLYHSLLFLISLPQRVSAGLDYALDNSTKLINLPIYMFELIGRGFLLLWHLLCTCVVSIFWAVLRLLSLPFRALLYVASSPYKIGRNIVLDILDSPNDAVFGLLVCAVIVYLWWIGLLPYLQRKICAKVRAFLRWLWAFSLRTAEWLLLVTAPQYAFALRVAKWLYASVVWLLTAMYRVTWGRRRRVNGTVEVQQEDSCLNMDSTQERLLCTVCQSEEKTVMTMPCRHLALCRTCAAHVMTRAGGRRCPLCRAHVRDTVDVYL